MTCDIAFITPPNWDVYNCVAHPTLCTTVLHILRCVEDEPHPLLGSVPLYVYPPCMQSPSIMAHTMSHCVTDIVIDLLCLFTMSNQSLTPPVCSDTHTQLVDAGDAQAKAELQSTPMQQKRHLDHDDKPYIAGTTSGAQRHVTDKTPKKRKTVSSLPSYVKLNVIQEAATVHGEPTEDG